MALTETSPEVVDVPAEREEPSPPAIVVAPGAAGNDHKVIGSAFLAIALIALVAGGMLAGILRAQLAVPDLDIANARLSRQLYTFHGLVMVFLFLLPAWIGVATAIVPLQIGAARLAFPRLQTLSLWLTAVGAATVALAPVASGGRRILSGWSLSDPFPVGDQFRGDAIEYVLVGLILVLAAAVLAAANLITTVVKLRAPGLTSRRLPLFTWSVVVSASILLLSLPILIAGFGLVFVEHHYGGHAFGELARDGRALGLVWPRMFWAGAWPMLWALLLPALGAISEIVPVFARRPIADRKRAIGAIAAVGVLAFWGFGSEVADMRGARELFVAGALIVLLPVASLAVNWLLTLRKAAKDRGVDSLMASVQSVPMMLALGTVAVLGAGLAAGAVSAIDASGDLHFNYWSVGEQHLLFFGPATLALVAAMHYWAPKLWGRHLSRGLGRVEVLLLVGGAFLTFLPALVLGLQEMPIHTVAYETNDDWQLANLAMSAGAGVLALGVVTFVVDLLVSVVFRRCRGADDDPWGGHTLEWAAPTPPPRHNFDTLPEIRSGTPVLDRAEAEVT